MNNKLSKKNILNKKETIDRLFLEGKTISSFPLRLVYMENQQRDCLEVGFSVPKRNIKLATDRNRIKRKIKEVFRVERSFFLKNDFIGCGFFIYTSKKEKDEKKIEKALQVLLKKWKESVISS